MIEDGEPKRVCVAGRQAHANAVARAREIRWSRIDVDRIHTHRGDEVQRDRAYRREAPCGRSDDEAQRVRLANCREFDAERIVEYVNAGTASPRQAPRDLGREHAGPDGHGDEDSVKPRDFHPGNLSGGDKRAIGLCLSAGRPAAAPCRLLPAAAPYTIRRTQTTPITQCQLRTRSESPAWRAPSPSPLCQSRPSSPTPRSW